MSTLSTRKFPPASEAECPVCRKMLSHRSDLKRHMNTQHPDGTEFKAECPYASCKYKADQKSNLKAHINAKHSINRYRCNECDKDFADPATRVRHRKRVHGYQPYHTATYLAKRALKEAEKKRDKAALSKDQDQQAASVVPGDTQYASSSSTESLGNSLVNATYHDDFWKLLLDAPRHDALELKVSQDVQISAPVDMLPARHTHRTPHSIYSDLSLPKVGQQPSTTNEKRDGTRLLGLQLDTTVQPQSQALAQLWTPYGQTTPGVASDYRPFAATFPESGCQSTYPDMGFQSLPAFSLTNVPLPVPNSFNFPATPTAQPSPRIYENQFVYPNYMTTLPLLEPVPSLSWTPSLSPANSTPLSQTEFFTDEVTRGFDTWHNFA